MWEFKASLVRDTPTQKKKSERKVGEGIRKEGRKGDRREGGKEKGQLKCDGGSYLSSLHSGACPLVLAQT